MAPAAGSSLACRVYPTQPFSAQAVAVQGSLQSGVQGGTMQGMQGMQGGMMQGGWQREPSAHKRTLQQARTRGGYRRGGLTLTP